MGKLQEVGMERLQEVAMERLQEAEERHQPVDRAKIIKVGR